MWDLSLLGLVPGIRIATPRDAPRLRELLREAVSVDDGPTVLRYQKGTVATETVAISQIGGMDVLARHGEEDVLLVAVGSMVGLALEVADGLTRQGIGVTVVDPRGVLPVDAALPPLAARYRLVVVVEDNGIAGGVASQVSAALRASRVPTALRGFGIPQQFLDHASRDQVLERIGLTAQEVSREVVEHFARQEANLADLP
jgi:1-deoxy-D-xylulose-5-phosphate synthase